jgi:hypothetical protein
VSGSQLKQRIACATFLGTRATAKDRWVLTQFDNPPTDALLVLHAERAACPYGT